MVEYRATLGSASGRRRADRPGRVSRGLVSPGHGMVPVVRRAVHLRDHDRRPRAATRRHVRTPHGGDHRGRPLRAPRSSPTRRWRSCRCSPGPYRVSERIHRGWRLRTYFHEQVADLADTLPRRRAALSRSLRRLDRRLSVLGLRGRLEPIPGRARAFPASPTWARRCCGCPSFPTRRSATRCCTRGGATACGPVRAATGRRASRPSWRTTRSSSARVAPRHATSAWRGCASSRSCPAAEDRPLPPSAARTHAASQATGYHKAAFVFIMLRDEIGADAFASGVRRFWQAHRFGVARVGRPGGTRSRARPAPPLAGFFAQWVQPRRRPRARRLPASASTPPAYPSRSRRPRRHMPWQSR